MADWTAINAERLASVYPPLRQRVQRAINLCAAAGVPVLVTCGLREMGEQAALYAKGRTAEEIVKRVKKHGKDGAVTDAPAGYSSHNFGMAVDVAPDNAALAGLQPDWNAAHPVWRQMSEIFTGCGLAELIPWDKPHFHLAELSDTPTSEMRQAFAASGLPAVWKLVDGMLAAKTPVPDLDGEISV